MTKDIRRQIYSLWVEEQPKSAKRTANSRTKYMKIIKQVAKKEIEKPLLSNRIDIEILFYTQVSLRADIDNVIKPVLEALKGIAYNDDRQVRSVKATAYPFGEAFGMNGLTSPEDVSRLLDLDQVEFMIVIYEGMEERGPGVKPDKK
jgi:Holliday junction resolvase RusA-like endonuclease